MYVYMHAYVHMHIMCIYIYTYAHIYYIHIYVMRTFVCMNVCMYSCMYICVHACMCACMYMYIKHACTCMHGCIFPKCLLASSIIEISNIHASSSSFVLARSAPGDGVLRPPSGQGRACPSCAKDFKFSAWSFISIVLARMVAVKAFLHAATYTQSCEEGLARDS